MKIFLLYRITNNLSMQYISHLRHIFDVKLRCEKTQIECIMNERRKKNDMQIAFKRSETREKKDDVCGRPKECSCVRMKYVRNCRNTPHNW